MERYYLCDMMLTNKHKLVNRIAWYAFFISSFFQYEIAISFSICDFMKNLA